MITEPIQLLKERLKEIKKVKDSAKRNRLDSIELDKLNKIHQRYYVSVEALSRFSNERFIDKGILYKGYVDVFRDQEREIKALKAKLSKMYRERSKDT
jgi:TRAP-type uncharacterized transport system substrate-binding protein